MMKKIMADREAAKEPLASGPFVQNGVDLKTVQKLLGHSDIESTMRYLAKAESKKVRAKVNAV
jgi:site-specific recombinase XerD